jgi:hypothetical protein
VDEAGALDTSQYDIFEWRRLTGRRIGGGIVRFPSLDDKIT